MTTATVSSKSQITLPAAACRQVGIKPHDRVLVEVREGAMIKPHDRVLVEVREGAIVIVSAPDLLAFKGVLGKALPPGTESERTAGFLARRHKKFR